MYNINFHRFEKKKKHRIEIRERPLKQNIDKFLSKVKTISLFGAKIKAKSKRIK